MKFLRDGIEACFKNSMFTQLTQLSQGGRCSRRYGYYRCYRCRRTWQSAYTWCEIGTCDPVHPQNCKRCNQSVLAHEVQELLKPDPEKQRHIDVSKRHVQELCHRCRNKPYPCPDSTIIRVRRRYQSKRFHPLRTPPSTPPRSPPRSPPKSPHYDIDDVDSPDLPRYQMSPTPPSSLYSPQKASRYEEVDHSEDSDVLSPICNEHQGEISEQCTGSSQLQCQSPVSISAVPSFSKKENDDAAVSPLCNEQADKKSVECCKDLSMTQSPVIIRPENNRKRSWTQTNNGLHQSTMAKQWETESQNTNGYDYNTISKALSQPIMRCHTAKRQRLMEKANMVDRIKRIVKERGWIFDSLTDYSSSSELKYNKRGQVLSIWIKRSSLLSLYVKPLGTGAREISVDSLKEKLISINSRVESLNESRPLTAAQKQLIERNRLAALDRRKAFLAKKRHEMEAA